MYERDAQGARSWGVASTALAAAAAANLTLLLTGQAAGASFTVPDRAQNGAVIDVGFAAVLLSTVVPLSAGLAATALLARRWPRARRVLQVLAVVVTLASLAMPLTTETDTGTRVLLAAMHLVVCGAYLAAARARQPHPATSRNAVAPAPERAL